jgi:hypothetical protein
MKATIAHEKEEDHLWATRRSRPPTRLRIRAAPSHSYTTYWIENGAPDDELCLVVNRRLSVRRQKLLDSLRVAVLVKTGAEFQAGNDHGSHLIDALTEPGA